MSGKGSRRGKTRGKTPGSSEPEQLPLFPAPAKRGRKRRVGRKRSARAGSPHKVRPELAARHPVHVVLRVIKDVGNLRRRFTYKAIREATLTAARREDFRIVHLSIQRTHVHLLVESGIHIIECLNLDELAAAGVAEFLLVALPLKIRGATGSPVRPVAIA